MTIEAERMIAFSKALVTAVIAAIAVEFPQNGACAESVRSVTVAADGSGQFATIQAAIDSVTNATERNPVDVLIKPGVYDREMVRTKDWVNLVGANRETCILKYTRKPEEMVHLTHVIWATSSSCIRDLTLVGGDVKYCIHSDGGKAYVLRVQNCTLRREIGGKGKAFAFGIGLHTDQHILMENCTVEGSLPIYLHNWNNQKRPCSMTIERCTLKGADYGLMISLLGSNQQDFCVLHDCVLVGTKAGILYKNAEKVPGRAWKGKNEFRLLGSGNTLATIEGGRMADDAGNRQSGLERARAASPRNTPRNGSPVSD